MVEGGMKCVKYLIFFFNFIFVISGIALVTLGAVIKGYYNKYLDFLGDGVVGAPILLIIVGVVIFFVAFMGCCGAIRESYCMTMTFAVLLALIFILELAAGITAYVLRDDIRTTLNTNMQATMQNYGKDDYDGVTKTWDGVQMEADCCGAFNYTEWADVEYGKSGDVPDSCCINSVEGCGAGVLLMSPEQAATVVHTRGCVPVMLGVVHDNWVWLTVAAAVLVAVEIVGILLGCCLARSYKYTGYSNVSV
ncbi:CD63 antigen-like isoform X1 [Amphibalanus amphitrite]|uniref:CD63 antigen-like isoform X1 n=1 Tax=Amphibalanus amphitrite TaxID=1232801 RepID=UPI001C92751D|nr:CD63 antigen-like isoform X1 [Amphibalanus amphitrite]